MTSPTTTGGAFGRIAPTDDVPEPMPPCGGSWIRDEEGGLTPADLATASRAGLAPAPAPAEANDTEA